MSKMIAVGWNTKLGDMASFSLQAGSTCPGKSDWCGAEGNCYATRGPIMFPQNQKRYADNLKASMQDDFVDLLVEEIRKSKKKTVRIHPAGDFYSVAYVKKWTEVAKRLPWVRFYAYTRSWRVKSMMSTLEELRAQPNVALYASMDDSIKEEPPEGWLEAWTGDIFQLVGTLCPENVSGTMTCAQCRHCVEGKGNVTFAAH